jgi:antitoxin component YwqK of YwqJK toxin-antitoxin module
MMRRGKMRFSRTLSKTRWWIGPVVAAVLLLPAGGPAAAASEDVYYPNKTLKARVNTRTNETGGVVRHGSFQRFHPNGRPAVEGRYLDGRRVGVWSWWGEEGRLLRRVRSDGPFEELLFGEDIRNPNTAYFNTAKKKLSEGILKFDKGHGKWTYWFNDGTPRARGNFLGGLPDGRWVLLYPDGQVRGIEEYRLGLRHGLFMKAYPNGQEEVEGRMDHGLRVGLWRFWYPSGQIKTEGKYRNDREEGEWRYWSEEGKLEKRAAFRAGEAVATLPLPSKPPRPPSVIPRALRERLDPPHVFDEDGREITRQD